MVFPGRYHRIRTTIAKGRATAIGEGQREHMELAKEYRRGRSARRDRVPQIKIPRIRGWST